MNVDAAGSLYALSGFVGKLARGHVTVIPYAHQLRGYDDAKLEVSNRLPVTKSKCWNQLRGSVIASAEGAGAPGPEERL